MLYESFNLEDGNASPTDTEDWDGVHFLSFEIISFGGKSPRCHCHSRKPFLGKNTRNIQQGQ